MIWDRNKIAVVQWRRDHDPKISSVWGRAGLSREDSLTLRSSRMGTTSVGRLMKMKTVDSETEPSGREGGRERRRKGKGLGELFYDLGEREDRLEIWKEGMKLRRRELGNCAAIGMRDRLGI